MRSEERERGRAAPPSCSARIKGDDQREVQGTALKKGANTPEYPVNLTRQAIFLLVCNELDTTSSLHMEPDLLASRPNFLCSGTSRKRHSYLYRQKKDVIVIEIAPHHQLQDILKRVIGPHAEYVGLMKRNVDNTVHLVQCHEILSCFDNSSNRNSIHNAKAQI
ncbi:hypothetical protein AVEN_57388-1 [Araneus ventricosus]|uniref:Uncharacterized protein n=1 Tax=Araneus ventricosus TaxID=182803 RepID=A0A4Y2CY60_ARAVE|nr:hypothetical protein AVEN_57388-1 [Araneus ventricosus]